LIDHRSTKCSLGQPTPLPRHSHSQLAKRQSYLRINIHPHRDLFPLLSPKVANTRAIRRLPDLSLGSSPSPSLGIHPSHHPLLPPPSPPPADTDPNVVSPWHTADGPTAISLVNHALPFSPVASPPPEQTHFTPVEDAGQMPSAMDRNTTLGNHTLGYAPFRSSPLANSGTRATIRRISETGEMEMEDTEEMDVDGDGERVNEVMTISPDEMTDDNLQEFAFSYLQAESLYRAGTPTPAVTPPFPQITVPAHAPPTVSQTLESTSNPVSNPVAAADNHPVVIWDNVLDGIMEEEGNTFEDFLETAHEIPTEELDTECTTHRRRAHSSFGCTTEKLLEFMVTVSTSETATSRFIQ
jgi:hypothetical protein